MNNPNSTDGIAEDIIRTITQLACSEAHIKTLIDKTTAEMAEGTIDVNDDEIVNAQLDKLDELGEELTETAELRRDIMRKLVHMYPDGDATYWCMVKHYAIASYAAFEAYQASDEDIELLDLAYKANRLFVRSLSHFLGTEITYCAACFGDMLKGEETDEEN